MGSKISVLVYITYVCMTVFGEVQLGPYKLVMWNVTSCPGSPGTQETEIYLVNQPSGAQQMNIDGYIKNSVGPLAAEMTWSVFRKTNYVAVFSLQTKRVCEVLKTKQAANMFPKVDNRCFLIKGPYHQEIADVNAANHVFLGNMMPYGKYMAKLILRTGRKLFLCKEFYYECIRI